MKRRDLLIGAGSITLGSLLLNSSAKADTAEFLIKQDETTLTSIEPITDSQPVEDYYDYDGDNTDSSNTPDDLETENATITFLHRDTSTGNLSLVIIHGDSEFISEEDDNNAILTFDGVSGFKWKVQDGPDGSGEFDTDDYANKSTGDSLDNGDTVGWGWDDDRTDGGALGFLGDSFDIEITHLAEGPRFDSTVQRQGLDRWLFIDGSDVENPIELADFTADDSGIDVSARLISGAPSDLALQNPRLVQVVEDTKIARSNGYQEPDPDLVEGLNTAALFDLTATNTEQLPTSVTVQVEWTNLRLVEYEIRTQTDTFDLSIDDIERIQEGADPRAIFHEAGNFPVFKNLDGGDAVLQSVTISIAPGNSAVNGDSVTLERGIDFNVQPASTLRVGFISVRDPEGGLWYGSSDTGEPQQYTETVREAAEHFEQQYPVSDLRIYRHDTPIRGATDENGEAIIGDPGPEIDTREARCTLEDQLPISAGNTLDGFQGEITEFDATVLIVPGGTEPEDGIGTENYFEFHYPLAGPLGFHPINLDDPSKSQPQRSSTALEGGAPEALDNRPWTNNKAAVTVTQEVGHHFEFEPYKGPTFGADDKSDHPLAQRRTSNNIDFGHADPYNDEEPPKVSSVGFDLRDGTFALGHEPSDGQPVDNQSFMAYEFSPPWWADSRIFKELRDGKFDPHPPESGGVLKQSIAMCTFRILEDGEVTDVSCSGCTTYPMVNLSSGSFTVSIRDADDEELESVTTSPSLGYETFGGSEDIEVEDIVPASLPFPNDAIAFEVTYDGTTTRIDPVSGLLRTAIVALPEQAFVRKPAQRRQALLNKADAVEKQMMGEAYRGAAQKLRNDVRGALRRWIADEYETAANVKTKAELLTLTDNLIDRVEAATGDRGHGRNGNGGN